MAPATLQPCDVPRASEETVDGSGRYEEEVLGQDPIFSPGDAWGRERNMVSGKKEMSMAWKGLRHAVGISLLLLTVFLWTASNFLASTIFADDSYSKPYLVTYINTAFFILPLIPMLLKHAWDDRAELAQSWRQRQPLRLHVRELLQRRAGRYKLLRDHESSSSSSSSIRSTSKSSQRTGSDASEMRLLNDHDASSSPLSSSRFPTSIESGPAIDYGKEDDFSAGDEGLTLKETGKLALEFCILWFLANYFASACLSYTTVASATILGSTSSIWTLACGALFRVEMFTSRKLFAVLASLAGVALISSIDVSGSLDDEGNRGSFPYKSARELAIGDVMAFVSAILYGIYAVLLKKRIGDESRVNMPLFFGLVGLSNVLFLWPGLLILHVAGIEPFQLPPTRKILTIVLLNSVGSLVSDFSWAYAMLLTSPLVVSVGLSLTIPLSLVGQMVISGQFASAAYWVGAVVMFVAFVFVNREEVREEVEAEADEGVGVGILNVEQRV